MAETGAEKKKKYENSWWAGRGRAGRMGAGELLCNALKKKISSLAIAG